LLVYIVLEFEFGLKFKCSFFELNIIFEFGCVIYIFMMHSK